MIWRIVGVDWKSKARGKMGKGVMRDGLVKNKGGGKSCEQG